MSAAMERQLDPVSAEILTRVLNEMQAAEELGGPAPDDYIALMECIAAEAAMRASNARGAIAKVQP